MIDVAHAVRSQLATIAAVMGALMLDDALVVRQPVLQPGGHRHLAQALAGEVVAHGLDDTRPDQAEAKVERIVEYVGDGR